MPVTLTRRISLKLYPGNALANLNPWPAEPQWYADVRTEYRNKFVNA